MAETRAQELVRLLSLVPHPEGGHYVETFRAPAQVAGAGGTRSASTAILFLLAAGEVSRWHRVRSDEVWHWHEGAPLELLTCTGPGAPVLRLPLGPVAANCLPQRVVPAGVWQAARPLGGHTLVGCTVAPGFDFADFTLVDADDGFARWALGQGDPRLVRR
ncbi:MAG: cupin domain-containing protein [Planctomycetes bacterium]|nr:cupin domain-containing protein [Planctomycetota bacterium]